MKIAARQITAFLKAPPERIRAILLFGPDGGLAYARGQRLAAAIGGREDPMRRRRLSGNAVSGEAIARDLAQPLLGGGRVALTLAGPFSSSAARGLPAALKALLRLPRLEGAAILIAGDLPPRSPLRQLAEKEPALAAIGCYPDTPAVLAQLAAARIKQAELKIEKAALESLVDALGADRGLNEQEINKLILYKGAGEIKLADVAAVLAPPALAAGEEIAEAAALGKINPLLQNFTLARSAGLSPAGWLEQSAVYFRRLHRLGALAEEGEPFEAAARKLRPPVHFSRLAAMRQAVHIWSPDAAAKAFRLLAEAVARMRQNAAASEAEAQLLTLARRAARVQRSNFSVKASN